MTKKDPYRAYRSAVTAFANACKSLVRARAYGIWDERYLENKKKYELMRVRLNRTVEKLIDKARKGEL